MANVTLINSDEDTFIKSTYNLRFKKEAPDQKPVTDKFPITESDEWSISEDSGEFLSLINEVSNHFNTKTFNERSTKPHNATKKIKVSKAKINKKKKFYCNICGTVCKSVNSYEKHKLKHFKKLIFQCNECQKTFKTESLLICHIKTIHLGVTPLRQKCEICGKSVLNITIHLLQHSDARFRCEICGKHFVKDSIYTEHLLVHSGVKSFRCEICQSSYTRKWNWKIHLKNHEKHRDADGRYLPLKPRGKAHCRYRQREQRLPIESVELQRKWKTVEENSKGCDTFTLGFDDEKGSILAEMCEVNGQKENVSDAPNVVTGSWEKALFSSRSCDTSDIEFYVEFLRNIAD